MTAFVLEARRPIDPQSKDAARASARGPQAKLQEERAQRERQKGRGCGGVDRVAGIGWQRLTIGCARGWHTYTRKASGAARSCAQRPAPPCWRSAARGAAVGAVAQVAS